MIQPFRELKAGMGLSAAELNRAFAAIEKATRVFVSPPLQLVQDEAGIRLRLAGGDGFFVRITGGGSGSGGSGGSGGGAPLGPNCYSGIQQGSYDDGTVFDYESGTTFDDSTFPLVEMTEAEDVPTDAIVWAWPSGDGTHYEFVWMGSGGTSSNVKVCRVAGQPITAGSVRYYPATFRTLNITTNAFNNGPAGGSYFDCWLVQDKDYDLTVVGDGDPGPDGPGAYMAILQDGGSKSLGGYSMPVYLTTEYPTLGPDCTVRN